jgi:5'-nucleotidase
MAVELNGTLVLGIASSALFDLTDANQVFETQGEELYRSYQREKVDEALRPGVAFALVRRLLAINEIAPDGARLVEVIVLSRNDPETGMRVMRSISQHGLDITRAVFMQGRAPYKFMDAFKMSLFLSANESDVREAIESGFAAGLVVGKPAADSVGNELKIAFDFDGVLVGDESEQIFQKQNLEAFQRNESEKAAVPMQRGLLANFLEAIHAIQRLEDELLKADSTYSRRIQVSIVTARQAPSHERVVNTLLAWNVRVNDAFFLGGLDKSHVLKVLSPHVFFDDQRKHLDAASNLIPCVHVPAGELNITSVQ